MNKTGGEGALIRPVEIAILISGSTQPLGVCASTQTHYFERSKTNVSNSVDDNEKFIDARLADPNKAEVRAWLGGHRDDYFINLGELESNEASLQLVNRFYEAGAIEIVAVEIDKYEGEGENTGKLVVVLPEGGEQRSKVFDLCSDIAQEQGFDPLEDFGQRRVLSCLTRVFMAERAQQQ